MKRILCYGDSYLCEHDPANTDSVTGLPKRYDEYTRRTGAMKGLLGAERN